MVEYAGYKIDEEQLNKKDKAFINYIKLRRSKKETLSRKNFDRIRKISNDQELKGS